MWIFAKAGFFSVVEDAKDPSKVLVRARRREDLAELGLGKIAETPESDYGFRIRVCKMRWARKMLELALEIDYPNFKNAVPHRKDVYGDVWAAVARLQKIPPFGAKGFELRDKVTAECFDNHRRSKNEGHSKAHQPRKGVRFYQNRQR